MSRLIRFSSLTMTVILLANILAACGSGQTATSAPTTVLSTDAANPTIVATESAVTEPAATEANAETPGTGTTPQATASTGESATPAIVAAANAFLETLDETQRAAVSFPYPSDQTTATAVDFGGRVGEQFGESVWSNYPVSDVIRPGLKMGDLTDTQREAVLTLLATTLSKQGYQKVLDIMNADQVLAEGGTNYASGKENYLIGLFGTPSDSTRWMLQFGGHHLGLNVTIQGAAMTMAPTLTGCDPCEFTDASGNTVRPLGAETDAAFALINALDATQQQQAILSYSVTDLVLGPGHDGQVLEPEGIPAASLNADQQALLLELVGNWVNMLNDASAQARMADLEANLADTYFAWSGPTTPGSAIYFRITGPSLHIEFANQGAMGGPGGGPGGAPGGTPAGGTPSGTPGGGQSNPPGTGSANHIHTIYRDPTNEYGTGLSQ
jgi:uncharacterized protein DUF3500